MQLLMSVASGRGIRTKRPSTKALEAGQHPEEEVSSLGEASSTLATAIGYAGHQCHEERIFNGTGKHMRGCIYSRGGRLPQLLAVINAMAEDDIPVPVKGSLYGTVSAYLALCAI